MDKLEQKIQEIHEIAIIIDGHSDILIPVHEGKMDLAEEQDVPPPEGWEPPDHLKDHPFRQFGMSSHTIYFGPMGQYDLPRFKKAGMAAQVCAVYLDDDKIQSGLKMGLEMVWHLTQIAKNIDSFELVRTAVDIRDVKKDGKVGLVLSFEGCEALGGDIRMLDLFYILGLRIASLTHTRNNLFAGGCGADQAKTGLTPAGRDLIIKMNELGIVIDLVHIGEAGFWEIVELSRDPLILSHSTPTMFPNSNPDLSQPLAGFPRPRLELPRDREKMNAIASNRGVLGLIWALHRDLEGVMQDIETALDIIGPDHIGLGSDLFGLDLAPVGLEDISKIPNLTRALLKRGHSDEVILKFLGGNYLRVFEEVWGG
jgi:membrane dipeptidase